MSTTVVSSLIFFYLSIFLCFYVSFPLRSFAFFNPLKNLTAIFLGNQSAPSQSQFPWRRRSTSGGVVSACVLLRRRRTVVSLTLIIIVISSSFRTCLRTQEE